MQEQVKDPLFSGNLPNKQQLKWGITFLESYETPKPYSPKNKNKKIVPLCASHSILHTIGRTYVIVGNRQIRFFYWSQLKQGRSEFCSCFILDLLMQQKFHCANLISRSWRTWKTNQTTPTNLTPPFVTLIQSNATWNLPLGYETHVLYGHDHNHL